MKKLILVACISLSIMGCSKSEPTQAPTPSEQTQTIPAEQSIITEQEAQSFAKNIYKKIELDEPVIKKAYESKQFLILDQYSKTFIAFTEKPYGEKEAKKEYGQRYFPEDPITEPYAICDRALNELGSLANTMKMALKSDSNELTQALKEKEIYFEESKHICKTRINMSYQQAAEAYEKSDSL
ncbi:hypothetical protein [Acinetobacter sp. TR11]|uniref:hypothetical protein n=1 Tax=Acinetobacter sp. TR11 TaxID=3003393 RepID=UPI0022ABE556|nr:hypothetical protein [Acinetobacter sp. TR11]WAU72904.1 hypothetical protein O1450_12535 [Acinetobacter sp. TR11]